MDLRLCITNQPSHGIGALGVRVYSWIEVVGIEHGAVVRSSLHGVDDRPIHTCLLHERGVRCTHAPNLNEWERF